MSTITIILATSAIIFMKYEKCQCQINIYNVDVLDILNV